MNIEIRRFIEKDIPLKVKWINDEKNNRFLHYDLPLSEEKTLLWFRSLQGRKDRADYTITCNGEPAGLIGLINIDSRNRKGEYYVALGEEKYKGRGVAFTASRLLLDKGFTVFNLNKIYLYTEVENLAAQKLFERLGFVKEGLLRQDLLQDGRRVDRFVYGLLAAEYRKENL